MLVELAFAFTVVAAPATQTATTPAQPAAGSAAWTASDEEISRGLVAAWRQNPQRNVCINRTPTGTRQERSVCGTLERWFNNRLPSEIANNRAPEDLIQEVKDQRARARAAGAGAAN